jgi:hypothetical protein
MRTRKPGHHHKRVSGEHKPKALLLKVEHTAEPTPREGERERDAERQPERGRTQASMVVATPVAWKRPAHLGGHSPLGSGREVKRDRRSRRGPVRPTRWGSRHRRPQRKEPGRLRTSQRAAPACVQPPKHQRLSWGCNADACGTALAYTAVYFSDEGTTLSRRDPPASC